VTGAEHWNFTASDLMPLSISPSAAPIGPFDLGLTLPPPDKAHGSTPPPHREMAGPLIATPDGERGVARWWADNIVYYISGLRLLY
jgi:hypothetical protein